MVKVWEYPLRTRPVLSICKVKIYSGTDNFQSTLRQFERDIYTRERQRRKKKNKKEKNERVFRSLLFFFYKTDSLSSVFFFFLKCAFCVCVVNGDEKR